jgi:hypothetical protein
MRDYDYDFSAADLDDDMPEGICDSCGEFCRATVIDEGIGPYEFWGSKGFHHDYVTCSPCCNAEVVEGGSKLLHRKTRTATKEIKLTNRKTVQAGERYVEEVYRNYRRNGPSWIVIKRYRAAAPVPASAQV